MRWYKGSNFVFSYETKGERQVGTLETRVRTYILERYPNVDHHGNIWGLAPENGPLPDCPIPDFINAYEEVFVENRIGYNDVCT